jgi:hypothetical protein
MDYDSQTRNKAFSTEEQMRGELTNVFLVLADPTNKRGQEALRLRESISLEWARRAAKGKWFSWPATEAKPGDQKLRDVDWPQEGMLGYLGYHVGEKQPTAREVRRRILEYAFECVLPPINGLTYFEAWGERSTAKRLYKLANTLAAFTRNAKRKDASSAKAVNDWESDLRFLRKKYYVDVFQFDWPDTFHLN